MSTADASNPIAEAAEIYAPLARSRRGVVSRVLRHQPGAVFGVVVLAVMILIAIFASVIAPYPENEKVGEPYESPSWSHPFGLDDAGVDVFSQVIYGAQVSLMVGFAAALVTMLIGGAVGIAAGYLGGKSDTVLMRITDYFLVIPDIPLMLVVAAIWGRSLRNIILIIGVIYWTTTARLVRAQVASLRQRVFVKRARAIGASNTRVVFRHILPQVAPLLVAITVLSVAFAIFAETALAFLGLGDPSRTSWGKMIENAFQGSAITVGAWWAIVPPGVAVALVVLACTLIGRALEEALNPRLRVGHLSVRRFSLRPVPPPRDAT
jgi:peptide/nickel transport system permease protein